MEHFYAIIGDILEVSMSEEMIFIVLGIIIVGFIIFISKQKQVSSTSKNIVADKINAMLELSPNEFASEFIAKKIADFASPNIKKLNLPKSTVKEVIYSAPKYMFEFSMLILYYACEIAKSRNKEITYDCILNFVTKSAISSMGMLAFGIDKKITMLLNRYLKID